MNSIDYNAFHYIGTGQPAPSFEPCFMEPKPARKYDDRSKALKCSDYQISGGCGNYKSGCYMPCYDGDSKTIASCRDAPYVKACTVPHNPQIDESVWTHHGNL